MDGGGPGPVKHTTIDEMPWPWGKKVVVPDEENVNLQDNDLDFYDQDKKPIVWDEEGYVATEENPSEKRFKKLLCNA